MNRKIPDDKVWLALVKGYSLADALLKVASELNIPLTADEAHAIQYGSEIDSLPATPASGDSARPCAKCGADSEDDCVCGW